MKKMLLSLSLIAGLATASHANSIRFINMLGCYFNFGINGVVGTSVFGGNNVIIGPGNTTFANPAQCPNVDYSGTAPLSTGTFQVIKGYPLTNEAAFVLGSIPGYPTSFNSAAVGSYPVCNNNTGYVATWSMSNGNIVVLIF